ncbi:LPS export ABC transporter periplasmic protein LptC [Caldimonas brevitalea]|uniref:Lipopolysaccharide export system protein LptC n=1 Tax=Caldimonas brevitalea TaxID=413882 RepID=A0A0G3BW37_9BURK|nr:LPS export ABC transporter periplasmic protein LptC [Caldimonas brevitalea]AKJ32238.1 lipopolysaccharide export system protein LptC [Caldimonas brevitalea]
MAAAPAGAPSNQGLQSWRRWIDDVSGYLPLLLLALLAAGTYWLVQHTPVPDGPQGEAAPRHEPDYVMTKFSLQHFTGAGRPSTWVEGLELRHFPDTDTLEIDKVKLRSVDEQGRITRGTANRALSNGDGSEIQLLGAAHVVREAGSGPKTSQNQRLEFSGEYLQVFTETERVVSHLPVTLRQGDVEVQGASLYYDNQERVLELKGQVRGSMPARPTSPSAAS